MVFYVENVRVPLILLVVLCALQSAVYLFVRSDSSAIIFILTASYSRLYASILDWCEKEVGTDGDYDVLVISLCRFRKASTLKFLAVNYYFSLEYFQSAWVKTVKYERKQSKFFQIFY